MNTESFLINEGHLKPIKNRVAKLVKADMNVNRAMAAMAEDNIDAAIFYLRDAGRKYHDRKWMLASEFCYEQADQASRLHVLVTNHNIKLNITGAF